MRLIFIITKDDHIFIGIEMLCLLEFYYGCIRFSTVQCFYAYVFALPSTLRFTVDSIGRTLSYIVHFLQLSDYCFVSSTAAKRFVFIVFFISGREQSISSEYSGWLWFNYGVPFALKFLSNGMWAGAVLEIHVMQVT